MGYGTFDAGAYRSYAAKTSTKTRDEIFESSRLDKSLDPKRVKMRESRDSAAHAQSTPIIVALDVTGSMGRLAEIIAKKGLGVLFNQILDRKPVTDPHLMFMAIGDANCDSAPLQVSQFESDNTIIPQLEKIYLEGGGGGNNFESYNLAWYFAANHTVHDSFIKRAKRGYLFTVGDEEAPNDLTVDQIKKIIGDTPQLAQSSAEMLSEAQRTYDVFHVMVGEGDYARGHESQVRKSWNNMIGQHSIWLPDVEKLAEAVVGAIEIVEGRDAKDVAGAFGSTVSDAVKHLPRSRTARLALKA